MSTRVLVVDDDPLFRDGMAQLLGRQADIEVVGDAADGSSALELAARVGPDVVLLDLLMPDMDGFETLPELRDLLPDAIIIVLTALNEMEATNEGILVGADAFLEKRHIPEALVPLVLGQLRPLS